MERGSISHRGAKLALALCIGAATLPVAGALGAEGDPDSSFGGDGRVVFSAGNSHAEGVAVDSKGRILEAGAIDVVDPAPTTTEQFAARIRREYDKWAQVVKEAKVEAE